MAALGPPSFLRSGQRGPLRGCSLAPLHTLLFGQGSHPQPSTRHVSLGCLPTHYGPGRGRATQGRLLPCWAPPAPLSRPPPPQAGRASPGVQAHPGHCGTPAVLPAFEAPGPLLLLLRRSFWPLPHFFARQKALLRPPPRVPSTAPGQRGQGGLASVAPGSWKEPPSFATASASRAAPAVSLVGLQPHTVLPPPSSSQAQASQEEVPGHGRGGHGRAIQAPAQHQERGEGPKNTSCRSWRRTGRGRRLTVGQSPPSPAVANVLVLPLLPSRALEPAESTSAQLQGQEGGPPKPPFPEEARVRKTPLEGCCPALPCPCLLLCLSVCPGGRDQTCRADGGGVAGEGSWPPPAGRGNRRCWGGGGGGDQRGEATYLAQRSPCASFQREMMPTPHLVLLHKRLLSHGCPKRPRQFHARGGGVGRVPNVSRHRAAAGWWWWWWGRTPVHDACMSCAAPPLAVRARAAPVSGGSYRKESGMEQSLGLGAAGWLCPPCWSCRARGGQGIPSQARPGASLLPACSCPRCGG